MLELLQLLVLFLQASSEDEAPPSRATASRHVATGRTPEAIAELERIVELAPSDAAAWFQLASLLEARDPEAASMAFEQAAEHPAFAARAWLRIARRHALSGERDAAWAAIDEARAGGLRSRAPLEADAAFGSLRGSERYAETIEALAPQPLPDPKAPTTFAEDDVEVLWVVESDTGLDRFGWQSEAVGDVDGDGAQDVLVGAPRSADGAPTGGKAYLYSGRTGKRLRTHVGDEAGGQFGYRVKGGLDFDDDGVSDYVVTAAGGNSKNGSVPPDHAGLDYPGYVLLFSGQTGEVIERLDGDGPSERFGFDAGMIPDLDGDGAPELLVGAQGADESFENAGRVYVFSGSDFEVLRVHEGEGVLHRLGASVGPLDDLDGDGVCDYVAGAPGAGVGKGGMAYVFSGKSGERLFTLDPARDEPEARIVEFGRFFASNAGDLDRDGVSDLYLADCFDQSAGLPSGRVYLYSGKDGSLLYSVAGTAQGDWYGIGRSLREDLDGDGAPELILASLSSADAVPFGGRVDILRGRDGERLRSLTCSTPFLSLGYDAHPVGDVNGDGIGDYFLTGSWAQWRADLRCRGVMVAGKKLGA